MYQDFPSQERNGTDHRRGYNNCKFISLQLSLFFSDLWLHSFSERLSIERLGKRYQGVDNVLGRAVNTR